MSSTAWRPLLRWLWPFYHHPHFLCNCPQASSLSCMTQRWVFVHVHGAGVSELAWMEKRCPDRVSRIQGELSWQHSPWGSQNKVHHREPRWALLKDHSCTQLPRRPTQAFVQIFSLGHEHLRCPHPSWELRREAHGIKDGRLGNLGHFWPLLGNRTSGSLCSSIGYLHMKDERPPLTKEETAGPSGCFYAEKRG